jgi:hypothetical protein
MGTDNDTAGNGAPPEAEQPDPPEGEQSRSDIPPHSSWAVALANSETRFQRLPGGGMVLTFNPLEPDAHGNPRLVSPQVQVMFGPDGWQRFKDEVGRDGVKSKLVYPPHAHR